MAFFDAFHGFLEALPFAEEANGMTLLSGCWSAMSRREQAGGSTKGEAHASVFY